MLNPLTLDEALDLLRHRMTIAEGEFDETFPTSTHKFIYNETNGVPRDLCVLCDAAMLNAFTMKKKKVDESAIEQALKDLSFKGWGKAA